METQLEHPCPQQRPTVKLAAFVVYVKGQCKGQSDQRVLQRAKYDRILTDKNE